MTSRPPFSEREKQFIRIHANTMSRGMIAQELAKQFPADNGGYRSWRSVKSFIYRERASIDAILTVKIPGSIVVSAKEAGYSLKDISALARKAIIEQYETII